MAFRRVSYESIPALSLRGPELRRAMRITTVAWMYGILWMTIVGGSRMNLFGRMLGFDDVAFGLLGAVPFIAKLGQLFATVLIERSGLRKYQFIYCASIGRLTWLGVAAVPLFSLLFGVPAIPSPWAVYLVLFLLTVSFLMDALAAPAWLNWMGDMIPRRVRGRYFASRMRWTEAIRMPAVIALAIFLDRVARTDVEVSPTAQPVLLWTLCALFALAAILGAIDILLFLRIREVVPTTPRDPRRSAVRIDLPPRPDVRQVQSPSPLSRMAYLAPYYLLWPGRLLASGARELVFTPLRDRVFRRYAMLAATVTFAMTVSGPFYWRHCLEFLRLSQLATDGLFMVIGPIVGIIAARRWGGLIDRFGCRPVMILGSLLTVFSIVPYFFSSPQTPSPRFVIDGVNAVGGLVGALFARPGWQPMSQHAPVGAWLVLSLSMVIGGIGWGGLTLAQHNIILSYNDGPGRSKYTALHAVCMGIGGLLGGIVGGVVAHLLRYYQHNPVIVGPLVWNNWHATFAITLVARVVAMFQAIALPEPNSGSVAELLGSLRPVQRLRATGSTPGMRTPAPAAGAAPADPSTVGEATDPED